MRSVILLAITLLVSVPALAQRNSVTTISPRAVSEIHRDFALEQAVTARSHRLEALLQPEAKAKLDLASRALLAHLASGPENAHPYVFAQQEVHRKFPHVSNEQSDLLSFYVMAEVARIISNPGELKKNLDDMNEMSEMTSLRLQMTMDRRSKFIETLSNIMKKISTTQDTVTQNVK